MSDPPTVSDGVFPNPLMSPDPSMMDVSPQELIAEDQSLTWYKVLGATQRGACHLTNSHGYTYVVSRIRPTATDWVCSVRNRQVKCKARVKEEGGIFYPGPAQHCHPACGEISSFMHNEWGEPANPPSNAPHNRLAVAGSDQAVEKRARKRKLAGGKKTIPMMPVLGGPPLTQFHNCRILRDHQLLREDLWVRDGKILNPEKLFFDEKRMADVRVDCGDCIIGPGFIDVQINGAFGADFSSPLDDPSDSLKRIAKGLLGHGVTSFCPTMVSSSPELYKKVLPVLYRREGSKDGASVLGVHVEGPFINKERHGAHLIELVTSFPNGMEDVISMYGSLDNISLVTLAPELTNARDVTHELVKRGIIVSLGHSNANLSEGEEAVKTGASFITHLFNAMLPFHHRDPHLVGLLTSDQVPKGRTLHYGMITDGVHTHPAALRIAHRTHPTGLVIVTDAVSPMGLSEGVHKIGQMTVEIKGNRAVLLGTDNLCGSISPFNECTKHFFESTECTMVEALESASTHPAEMLRITDMKGTLNFETDADLVILDDDLNLKATYIAGQCVWAAIQ